MSVGAPIITLVLIVIVLSFTLVSGFARQQDRAFADSSRRLVENALRERVRALNNIAIDFSIWNDAYAATTLHWDPAWLDDNYSSNVADALIIIAPDKEIRYAWLADAQRAVADEISERVAETSASIDLSALARRHDDEAFAGFGIVGDKPAIISFAPIRPERRSAAARRSQRTTNFLAVIDVLSRDELATIGGTLELHDLSFVRDGIDQEHSLAFPVANAESDPIGAFVWPRQRPGADAFAGQIWPIVVSLLLIGALTVLIARRLTCEHVEAQVQADGAREASRLKSEFIATMSHELRTPLNTIIGYTELLQEQAESLGDAGAAIGEDAERVLEGANNLGRLINNILDQSRIDAGRLQLAIEAVEVTEILAELEELMAPLARVNANRFTVNTEGFVGAVKADPVRLQQCLVNLTRNALKFTRGGCVRVNGRRSTNGEMIAFDVSDTGVGIHADELERLFQPFPAPAVGGGAGLSLSITRSLARLMGGDVAARSTLGAGSIFTLTLPAAQARAKAAA